MLTLDQIRLVDGRAEQNQAVIRLTIDAASLDAAPTIKAGLGQYEGGKGKGKRYSTESTIVGKNIQMVLEINVSYTLPTYDDEGVVEKLVWGGMDYTLWYGSPEEVETNMLVVEAKSPNLLADGRYQAISYMALIQHALQKAGRLRWEIRNKYSKCIIYTWESHSREIFSYVVHMVSAATQLSPTTTYESMPASEVIKGWMGIEH
ncbi:uncharacterized protein BJX67DRAFT_381274 [Aspergillus lucknowensis]|uniref:Uncharacterized protein n=1 Tax=Aspergillus lucknowensis TaxID=176173 RepID=A0ABR4LRV5_9EURO